MLEVETPRGKALAAFMIDYGELGNLVWVCFLRKSGECWSYQNPDILLSPCETMKIRQQPICKGVLDTCSD